MKHKAASAILCILVSFVLYPKNELKADLVYWPSEYNDIFNDSVALDLELNTLKRQYTNEKIILEFERKILENEINHLKKQLLNAETRAKESAAGSDKKLNNCYRLNDILKRNGSAREKELVKENKNLQKKFGDDINALQKKLNQDRADNLNELNQLQQQNDKQISELNARINNLNNELFSLKKTGKSQKEELMRLESQAKDLEEQLKDEITRGEIRLKRFHDRIVINLDDKICFDSGSSYLKPDIIPALKKIMIIMSKYKENRIVIEGHTDNVPIYTAKFRDNWQLSTERALSVLNYLLKSTHLNPNRFTAAGYADYQPIVPNNSSKNRSLNRRVDIVVIPRVANNY